MSTTEPLRTVKAADQLATHAIAASARGGDRSLRLPPVERRLALVLSVIESYSRTNSYALTQHVSSRLFSYERHFAPQERWHLIADDPAQGLLAWRHAYDPRLPPVIDVLTSTASDVPRIRPSSQVITRVCDLSDHRSSTIHFPGESHTWPLCAADDPIRLGYSAYAPGTDTHLHEEVSA